MASRVVTHIPVALRCLPLHHTCPKSVSVFDSIWFTSEKQRLDQCRLSFKNCLFRGPNEAGTGQLWPLGKSHCSWTAFRRRWQPGFRYPGQTRTKSPIESTFRTSSPRIPRFLDSNAFAYNPHNKGDVSKWRIGYIRYRRPTVLQIHAAALFDHAPKARRESTQVQLRDLSYSSGNRVGDVFFFAV